MTSSNAFVVKLALIGLLLVGITSDLSAQVNSAVIRALYNTAENAYYDTDYRKAINIYKQLDSLDTEDDPFYKFRIGLCYLYSNLDDGGKAIQYIESAVPGLGESDLADLVYYNLGRAYHVDNRHDDAIEAYQKVLDLGYDDKAMEREVKRQIQMCKNAKALMANPTDVTIKNTGSHINTEYPDYKPVISADESTMVFTSANSGSTGGKTDKSGSYYEDIYITHRDEYGNWDSPQNIGSTINTEVDEASVGLSVDGRQLIIYKGRRNGGELYTSILEGDKWSEPQLFNENINSKGWETHASLSSDGKTMYFTSDRKGGYGGIDIYEATLQDNGEWGPARNLGPTINTIYDEESPFIHPDDKTLYFSSAGHNSMGSFDIFKSVHDGTSWGPVENMGSPINTSQSDVHFVLTANGRRGYYTSSKIGGQGEEDIYMIDFDGSTVPLILVRGNVYRKDAPAGEPFNVKMKVISREDGQIVQHVYDPDPITGQYLLILPPGKNYDMIVEAEDFRPYLFNINIPDQREFREFYQQIQMEAIPPEGPRMAEKISVVQAFDDYRDLEDGKHAELGAKANTTNADYLKILMENIMEANENGDSAKIVAENLAKIFKATELVTDELATMETAELEEVAEALEDKGEQETNVSLAVYTHYDEEPDKGLVEYEVDGETVLVVPQGYMDEPVMASDPQDPTDPQDPQDPKDPNDPKDPAPTPTPPAGTYADILFGFDQSELAESYRKDLDKLVKQLKMNPDWKVDLEGHTDSKGSDSYNLLLSRRRANTVADYLRGAGIARDRIKVKGYGESRPKAPNNHPDGSDNEQGRKLNRRTEVKVTK